VSKSRSPYPPLSADQCGQRVVSHAGAVVLLQTAKRTGLTDVLSTASAPWRKPLANHDPGKIVCDLAIALALGGDCLADVGLLSSRAGRIWVGGLRPDGVAADHRIGRRCFQSAGGYCLGPGRGAKHGVESLRGSLTRSWCPRRGATDH
jgi:Transposase DDE domain group 1